MGLKFKVEVTDEQIQEAFENAEVKFSKRKLKELMLQYELEGNTDLLERLEEAVVEFIEEAVVDLFGK